MTATRQGLPALPHWETPPPDLPGAIREIKTALRARIEDSGRSVEEVFAVVEDRIRARVTEIERMRELGQPVWPVIEYSDIAAGTVGAEQVEAVRRRGCLVVRGHFERSQALLWDTRIVDYVERNGFFEAYRGPADDFFGSVGSQPEIYPIYWSPPQMQARQSARMARVQAFLNSFWRHSSNGVRWFDPGRDALYPDRVRRRPEGADSAGLGPHCDAGTLDLWMTAGYQRAFRHLFDGAVEDYDPWDAAHRTSGAQYPGSTMCSAFRTFQGWTALSDIDHDQGALRTVPIPEAMAYQMLRPLLRDVPEDEMCGVSTDQVFPADPEWHSELLDGLTGIPDVRAGDSVWWHCDLVHGVAPVADQRGWGNVMYIPAAPWCPRNEAYAASVREAFRSGSSPADFPPEHYERDWEGRFSFEQLNETGRRGMGFE
ncbi:YbiU family protein [Saccharopolyspora griseoalba]|uniref:YbiU family protein n=1 Tax=Saccharopolyspora griseoalba TaxID=1431848 RepID=A0ABW2LNZ7_9PSEU